MQSNDRSCSEGSFQIVGGQRVWWSPEGIKKAEERLELERAAVARERWSWRESWPGEVSCDGYSCLEGQVCEARGSEESEGD